MAKNMNTQIKALCHEIYEQDGLAAVRDLAKQIAPWCKERVEMEKRGAAEAKLQMRLSFRRGMQQPRKALIRELRKNETFKQMKIQIADAEKAARKAAADAKKLAAAEAKANKPSKVDTAMIKRWNKVLTKGIKRGETSTKKALTQLKQLKTKKRKADAKAAKAAKEAAKKAAPKAKKTKNKAVAEAAVGDDLIATLLAKANETVAAPPVEDTLVVRFEHDGVKYLKNSKGYLYDPETQDEVGFWNGSEVEELEDM